MQLLGSLVSVDGQQVEQAESVVDGLEQILVVLDHLAAHVDATRYGATWTIRVRVYSERFS
jgi:hypothetical protein